MNEVLPILEVEQSVKNDIRNFVNAGRTVTIPEKSIQYYGWSGTGYIVMDLETGSAGYMISGGIAGGAMSVGEALSKFVGYVVTGLFAMVVFHLIETAVLVLVPCGWIVGAVKIIQAIKITLAIIGLMMFMYNASMLIEMYNATGDVYYLQELLLQISALCTLLALNLGPLKGLNQKIDGLKGEIVAIKDAVAQMQARGVPTNVTNDYLKTYGVGRILPATEAIGYFKDYGLSDDAIATIGGKFEAATIELIKNTYMKSAVIYTGQDTNAILILFRQAGNESAASGLSNSIITLSNSGIVPSVYGEYGIIQSVSGLLPAVTAINKGITSSQIKTLLGLGIEPSNYDNYGIGDQDSAETVAEAVNRIKNNLINRIAGESGFLLRYSEKEISDIVIAGKNLGLDEKVIEDFMFTGSRVEKAINSGELMLHMDNYVNIVSKRGFPFKFDSLQNFRDFKTSLKSLLQKYNIPIEDVRIQGSSVRTPGANDVDIGVFVNESKFNELYNAMKAGIESRTTEGSAIRKSLLEGLEKGKADGRINSYYFDRVNGSGGATFGQELFELVDYTNMGRVWESGKGPFDLSVIIEGRGFDVGPFLNTTN